jgi:hypothetical protein
MANPGDHIDAAGCSLHEVSLGRSDDGLGVAITFECNCHHQAMTPIVINLKDAAELACAITKALLTAVTRKSPYPWPPPTNRQPGQDE